MHVIKNINCYSMKYLRYLTIIFLIYACARVGKPTGGDKDVTPPKLLLSVPANESLNFKGQEIILEFDEYVTIRELMKNLLISPPLKNQPVIKPAGIASKRFKIEFQDSLNPNTTYQINFGESIADYNEGNKLKNFKLVFSTGPVIDSLSLKGKVTPVHFDKKPEIILVGLYKAGTFNDSLVFRQKPYYVTVADDKGNFELNFLKAGTYRIVALEDSNHDYKYQQGDESIGFINKTVIIPGDSLIQLNLFKELPPFSVEDIEHKSVNHILVKFKGHPDSLKVTIKSPLKRQLSFINNDEWHLWYETKQDSIKLEIPLTGGRIRKFYHKRNDKIDSLQVMLAVNNRLNPLDSVMISANMPLDKIDSNKIQLLADSVAVPFGLIHLAKRRFNLKFDKISGKTYNLTLLPGAVTGFTGPVNEDTLKKNFKIPGKEAFGKLILHLNNTHQIPLFIELIKNNKTVRKTPTQNGNDFTMTYLTPGTYSLRIIVDTNHNNLWDTGNYLKHIQPEQSLEPDKKIEIRANWDVNQSLILDELK